MTKHLMNKTTELNFLLRQKEEEIQTCNRKNNHIQIDLNNSKNIEKSLNLEIQEIQNSRNSTEQELQKLKDENCKLQVENRKCSQAMENYKRECNQLQVSLDQETNKVSQLQSNVDQHSSQIEESKIERNIAKGYAKEKEFINDELVNIQNMITDLNDYRGMNENQKLKFSHTHEMITDVLRNLISQISDNDYVNDIFVSSKQQNFSKSLKTKFGGMSTYDSNKGFKTEFSASKNRYNFDSKNDSEYSNSKVIIPSKYSINITECRAAGKTSTTNMRDNFNIFHS